MGYVFLLEKIKLSLLKFDYILKAFTALRLFEYLFKVADHYDNNLIDNFNAKWLIIQDLYGMVLVHMLNVENNMVL